MTEDTNLRIVVVGLGYVGLPLAIVLADHFDTIGVDIDADRVADLIRGRDRTNTVAPERLRSTRLTITSRFDEIEAADVFILAVPTPVDADKVPDLSHLEAAARQVGAKLDAVRRPIICIESTVYPGVTEDVCGPILEHVSGLVRSRDFFLGYSPERINPGDREHTIDKVVKVVAGENSDVTERLAAIYGKVSDAGTFKAPSIRVAEAAKVIENAQRDLNIAFMNEIAQIFSAAGLSVWDVLETARTKWNFLAFEPGLVGGHCIGVDPYYLAHRATVVGHDPTIILAGREINDGMAEWVARRLTALIEPSATVLVLGLTFKQDVPDLRNTKVVDLIAHLKAFGCAVDVADAFADPVEAERYHGLTLTSAPADHAYDAVIVAVPHAPYRQAGIAGASRFLAPGGLLADLKGAFDPAAVPEGSRYWRL